jgi:hypothetical protein
MAEIGVSVTVGAAMHRSLSRVLHLRRHDAGVQEFRGAIRNGASLPPDDRLRHR